MTLPRRCGPDCVIPVDTSRAHPLSVSARPDGAWVIDDLVIRTIADSGHSPGHPFDFENAGATIEIRAGLLREIMDARPSHVLPVVAVCSCSFASPYVKGRPIQDFGLGADGNRLINPHERRVKWAPTTLERHLADLASGLQELHQLGVAHGDPALMNAYVEGSDQPAALWIDLNSVQPAGVEAVNVDIAAFESTCLWPALIDAEVHSPSLFADLTSAGAESPEPLVSYANILRQGRADHAPDGARADLLHNLSRTDPSNRDDLLGRTRRRLSAAMHIEPAQSLPCARENP